MGWTTDEWLDRAVSLAKRDGGMSTFELEQNHKLACAVTDCIESGRLEADDSRGYPWVGLRVPGRARSGNE